MDEENNRNDEGTTKDTFKPQKELVYNSLLPYADHLKEEALKWLAEIKANLGRSVMLREIRPGCITWVTRLSKYIRLYGLNFSKEDHIIFIKLMYELVTIPALEGLVIVRFSQMLIILLKKTDLLSPADLELPWRPLYDLYESVVYSPYEPLGMVLHPLTLEGNLKVLIRACRNYFPVSATAEMLEEWRPLMCPFDMTMVKAVNYFELFLPTNIPPEHSDKGYKLWFEEFMGIWEVCHNSATWDGSFFWLTARLANDNIGYIDWEPYIPLMFTRILRNFNLPVVYKKMQVCRPQNIEISATVTWITAVLGPNSSAQMYVDKLFKTLESYYHPANLGKWFCKLQPFLNKLPTSFIKRLHRERYKKLTWETLIPASHKLTEEDITRFVKCVLPVALQAMFSRLGGQVSSMTFHHLATVRPELVIPPLIERLYTALETVTEPHTLTATMHCVIAVARSMVLRSKYYYEGQTIVIPILLSSLPGIDPNDMTKCMTTFQFIATFASLIPFVDCSQAEEYWKDLTEEEHTVCLATASFEDFIMQFMDRCFSLIESISLTNTRMDHNMECISGDENMLQGGMSSTFTVILTQSSPQIFQSALRKLQTFIAGRVFETKLAGKFIANMCRSATTVNPEEALKAFLPSIYHKIQSMTVADDILKEERLDAELLFSLLLLAELPRCSERFLVPYIPQLMEVLDCCLFFACKEGAELAANMLRHMLRALTFTCPTEYRSTPHVKPLQEHLPVRDWGKAGDVHNLNIHWHVPCEEETDAARKLVGKYLTTEMDRIEKYIAGEEMTREKLQQSLNIILQVLLGCGTMLPYWEEKPLQLMETQVNLKPFEHTVFLGDNVLNLPDGRNVRKVTADLMHQLQTKMLISAEDDTKSFFHIISIYQTLLIYQGVPKDDFDTCWKNFQLVKRAMENKLLCGKKHVRALLVDRIRLQHELRVLENCSTPFTATHWKIMSDLLLLCTSFYSDVRTKAQGVFGSTLQHYSYSYLLVIPEVVKYLKEGSQISHEQFKGALYVILGNKAKSLLVKHDWKTLSIVWPSVLESMASEKPSIIKLLESIAESIHKHYNTFNIKLEIPDQCVEAAQNLWDTAKPHPSLPRPTVEVVMAGSERLQQLSEDNLQIYYKLLERVTDLLESGTLHWRHYNMGTTMLSHMIRHDLHFPPRVVKLMMQNLVHDTLAVRKLAIHTVACILKQQKRTHKKVEIDPLHLGQSGYSRANSPKNDASAPQPGDRPDNEWLQYNSKKPWGTVEGKDTAVYVHKTHYGYYNWPQPMLVYAAASEQPPLDRTTDQLSAEEQEVDKFFSSAEHVEKLIGFLSLEERKGKDKFDAKRFSMFKGLFRNMGDRYVIHFKGHLQRLVTDSHESSQRCAAEIIAGLIRGAKHWPVHKTQSLWGLLIPLIQTALSNVTVETVGDWGTCIATASESRDPNWLHPLLEELMEDPLRAQDGSFIEASRLYILQGGICQQEWRVSELLHRLLNYLKIYFTHSYQNVRARIGSVLRNIFIHDIILPNGHKSASPRITEFIPELVPQLSVLYQENDVSCVEKSPSPEISVSSEISISSNKREVDKMENKTQNSLFESEEKEVAMRLLKTVCRWLSGSITQSYYTMYVEFYQLLPIFCLMEGNEQDPEISRECSVTLACMAQSTLLPNVIPVALDTIRQIMGYSSWRVRLACLEYLQVMVFHSMCSLLSQEEWIQQVTDIVLRLLCDERVEVREKAAEVLGGLLHCGFIVTTTKLLETFKLKSSTKLKKKKLPSDPVSAEGIIERHSGILGLCAFINASPYDVPQYMPDALMVLGDHLNDPHPIPATIKKTLQNFKRTHIGNWQDHKLKFSDDQLAVLTDLLVSPSYYA